jgi:uncharacterized protein involved in exopolysaccharide biosynthesis
MKPLQSTGDDSSIREQLSQLTAFIRRALRFWSVMAVTLLLGGAALAVFLYVRQPRFRSETVIIYADKGGVNRAPDSSETQRGVSARLKELVFSRPILERIVKRFDLYPEVRARFGMIDAVEELKKHVEFRAPGGDTFSIAFEGTSPSQAQAATAELARQVIEGDAELRRKQATLALDFLTEERKNREKDLRAAEEALAGFMAEHPRFALDATPLANGAAVRASMAPGRTATDPLPARSWAPSARASTPTSGGASAPAEDANKASANRARSPDEARAQAALAAAREDLAEKLVRYTPVHPDVRAAQAEVQRATERLAALTNAEPPKVATSEPAAPSSSSSSPPPPAAPRAPARAWQPPPARPAPTQENLVDLETQWLKLTRSVTEARQRTDQIESQLFRADIEVSSERGGHAVQVSVIDPAFLPQSPLPPGKTTLGLVFLLASVTLGSLAMLLCAAFSQRVFVARDLAGVGELLVEVPKATRRAHVAG